MTDSIWKTLSAIDCREHTEKKGQFSYLAWTWAWAMVKENYPLSLYSIKPDTVYSDGTMEVRVSVSIPETNNINIAIAQGQSLTHTMWLPVLDFKNKAIQNPNAFDINSSRMRCLVKCLAMFGLGHYIYAGESAPQEPVIEETPIMVEAGAQLNACFEAEDYDGAAQIYNEWSHEENSIICRAASKGGELMPANRVKLKSTEFRMALNAARGISA
jgi:hypothetical protein|tara:strand:- start:553 stop:1197 length:645 start_codon:yes stop_codon:yes gene_type:complete